MKFAIAAARLGQVLALRSKKPPMLAHLIAADAAVSILSCDGNIAVKAMVPADVFQPGEVAVSADRLGALVGAIAAGATVVMTVAKGGVLTVTSGNGRYRLPTADAPAALAITTGKVTEIEISTVDLLTLFAPLPAAASEPTRFYLCGLFLHGVTGRLCAAATDGVTLLQASVAADKAFPCSIVPTSAAATMMRLVKATRPEKLKLRRGGPLLDLVAPDFICTTRLIDTAYPEYESILPAPSANVAACTQSDLSAALERLTATAVILPLVALRWTEGRPLQLFLPRQPDDGADIVAARTTGFAQIALSLPALADLVAEFGSEELRLEVEQNRAVVIRTDRKLGMLTSCRWNFREAEALSA
jgi:DNA polymerase-3 subunit beta